MGATYAQVNFTGGEWSKEAQGRFDLPAYRTALNVCLNAYPIEQGAWRRRSGTRHAWQTRGGAAGRVMNWDFREASPYSIEFTDGWMRFRLGPNLVYSNDAQTVTSISAANPAKVLTGTHGWATGNQGVFAALGANSPALQQRQMAITVTSSTQFTIADAVTGVAIDGSAIGSFVSGTFNRILEFATPYVGGEWQAARLVQADIQTPAGSETVGVFLHSYHPPQVLTVVTEPTATQSATFTFAPAVLKDGPYFDLVPGGALATPSAVNGNITITLSFNAYDATRAYAIGDYVTASSVNYKSLTDANVGNTPASSPSNWVAVSAADPIGPNGFTGDDVGRLIRLHSEPGLWDYNTTYGAGQQVAYAGTYWTSQQGTNLHIPPGTNIAYWALMTTAALWTWGKITGLSNLINRALSGSANIGDMTEGGNIGAAFDGVVSKIATGCAEWAASGPVATGTGVTLINYVGKNYTGASDQRIEHVTIFPSSDSGFAFGWQTTVTPFFGQQISPFTPAVLLNLRGKASAPTSSGDGTLLGTSGIFFNTSSPVTIISTDQATAWKYLWVEMLSTVPIVDIFHGAPIAQTNSYILTNAISQIQYFSPTSTGTGDGVTVQILGDALLYQATIREWRLGLFSNRTGWPTCGTYHEGRLGLSGVVPNRFDLSVANDPFNFAPTAPDGTVLGNSAIGYVLNAKDLNPIFWMETDDIGMLLGTQAGEWLVQATTLNAPLTPTTIQAHRVTKNGCANIEPKRTDLTLAVVQKFRRNTLEMFGDVYSGKFATQDLSKNSKHINASGIAELAYQQQINPIIWQRLSDGSWSGITYDRVTKLSAQPPEMMGAHRHVLGSGRIVESIAVCGSIDGTLDALTMVTADPTGLRHVEVLATEFTETDALANAFMLDNAIVPQSTVVSTNFVIQGLWPHETLTVSVFAGGLYVGDYVVTGGVVTIEFGDGSTGGAGGGLFTASFVSGFSGAMPLLVGFGFDSDGQLLRPQTPAETGARNGPALGKTRRNHKFAMLMNGCVTDSVSVGTSFDKLLPVTLKQANGVTLSKLTPYTGVRKDTIKDDQSLDGQICWRVSGPYPATIAAVQGFIDTVDE